MIKPAFNPGKRWIWRGDYLAAHQTRFNDLFRASTSVVVGCTAIAGLATRPRAKVAGRVHGGEEVRRWGWTKNFEGLCPRSRGDRVGKLHARIDSIGVT
jgi:hypothetical protein